MKRVMLHTKASLQIAWLATMLGEQKDSLARLLRSLSGFVTRGSMKPSHFHKFLLVLNQIADAKDKEAELINRIEAVEQRHRFARVNDQLKEAPQYQSSTPTPQFTSAPEAKRPGMSLLWILLLWQILQGRRFGQK